MGSIKAFFVALLLVTPHPPSWITPTLKHDALEPSEGPGTLCTSLTPPDSAT